MAVRLPRFPCQAPFENLPSRGPRPATSGGRADKTSIEITGGMEMLLPRPRACDVGRGGRGHGGYRQ